MPKRSHLPLILFVTSQLGGCSLPPPVSEDVADSCQNEGEHRCQAQHHQVCAGGKYQTLFECGLAEQCDVQQICVGTSECGGGTDLIYAVDTENRLLSFNPRHDFHRFQQIGNLDCPAGPAVSGVGIGTPYSMAVDRQAGTLVLYSSGEIFAVNTATAKCASTRIKPGTAGFSLFGMGFVSNDGGQAGEKLYIAGSTSKGSAASSLGLIDTQGLQVQNLGTLLSWPKHPELSGTGAGDLFAYFPGKDNSQVVQLDKQTRAARRTWPLPGTSGEVLGWAFAHWGGRFYIFLTTDQNGRQVNDVIRFDPKDGSHVVVAADTPYPVFGAGVSTCAPYIIG